MSDIYRVHGAVGSGSVVVEAALTLMGLHYTVVESAPWGPPEAKARAEAVNPLAQVPSVILPDGAIMTESAAILLRLTELASDAGLAPGPEAPERAAFLRWMVYVPANIYAMYLLKDDPTVWLHDRDAQEELRERAIERIKTCWTVMEASVAPAPWLLGDAMSVLDLYVTVVSRWTPGRRWFEAACPKLNAVAERLDAEPRLAALWAARFPFEEGWRQ